MLAFFIVFFAAVESQVSFILKTEHRLFGAGDTPGGVLIGKVLLFGFTLILTAIFASALSSSAIEPNE